MHTETTDDTATFYDQHTAPCSPSAFLRAAKRGEFRSFRPGKRLLALRSEVDAWVLRHEQTPEQVA